MCQFRTKSEARNDVPNTHCSVVTFVHVAAVQVGHLGILTHNRDGLDSFLRKRQTPRRNASRGAVGSAPAILQQHSRSRGDFPGECSVLVRSNVHPEIAGSRSVLFLCVEVGWGVVLVNDLPCEKDMELAIRTPDLVLVKPVPGCEDTSDHLVETLAGKELQ